MIIIKIASGLGNQLFQYAFAKSLTQKTDIEIKIDTSCFDLPKNTITPRPFLLDKFKISLQIADRNDFKKIGVPYPADRTFKENIRRVVFKLKEFFRTKRNRKIIINHNLNFNESMFNIPDNSYVSGAWTNENYFNNIRTIIGEEFSPKFDLGSKSKELMSEIQNSNSISVHIRRGDYLRYTHKFKILSEDYYNGAVKLIKEKVKNPMFFIFSDDINYVKENYSKIFGSNSVYVSGQNIPDYEELYLMNNCKHNIIANSTFSWWGAWLNHNNNKIVIAPKQYRQDDKEMSDFIPKSWISI